MQPGHDPVRTVVMPPMTTDDDPQHAPLVSASHQQSNCDCSALSAAARN